MLKGSVLPDPHSYKIGAIPIVPGEQKDPPVQSTAGLHQIILLVSKWAHQRGICLLQYLSVYLSFILSLSIGLFVYLSATSARASSSNSLAVPRPGDCHHFGEVRP